MRGFILTYNSSKRKDITRINYFLFGRVAVNKGEKYYYPGFFENTPYKKIANGCYFVKEINDDFDGLLEILPASIDFEDDVMLNSKDYWKDKISSEVKNWK